MNEKRHKQNYGISEWMEMESNYWWASFDSKRFKFKFKIKIFSIINTDSFVTVLGLLETTHNTFNRFTALVNLVTKSPLRQRRLLDSVTYDEFLSQSINSKYRNNVY